jgi:hypothetical protein
MDADQNHVEIWRPGALEADVRSNVVNWQPEASIGALRIDLQEIFRPLQ